MDHRLADEAAFRLLVDSVQDYAIYMLKPTGHVASWNEGAHRIKGYEAESTEGEGSRFHFTLRIAAEGQKHLAR